MQLPNGKYEVHLVGRGEEVSRRRTRPGAFAVAVNDWIDVGVLDADGKYLYLQKHKISQREDGADLTVDKLPAKAGIDPVDKLIDRNPDDNVIAVVKR